MKAKPHIRLFETTRAAYDAAQTDDRIATGANAVGATIMVIPPEKVVGLLCDAWPVAVTLEYGAFHAIAPGTVPHLIETTGRPGTMALPEPVCRAAVAEAVRRGFTLSTEWRRYAGVEPEVVASFATARNARRIRIFADHDGTFSFGEFRGLALVARGANYPSREEVDGRVADLIRIAKEVDGIVFKPVATPS